MDNDRIASPVADDANPWAKPPGGGVNPPKSSRGRKGVIYLVSLALVVAGVGFGGFALQGVDWQGEASRKQEADDAFRARVETDVKGLLRDPLSATFQDVFYWPDTAAACGQVNSKNGLGGYSGFEPFAYHDGRVAFLNQDTKAYSRLIRACQRPRLASTKRLVQSTIDTVEASTMTDA
jgi:hypothetical protein